MDAADTKSLIRALFILRQERKANPRLGMNPPSPEEIEGARAALRRMDGLQMYQVLIEQRNLVGQYFDI